MNYHTDLILGEAFGIFIVFHFPDPGLFVLTSLHFYFSWRDSENTDIAVSSEKNFPVNFYG